MSRRHLLAWLAPIGVAGVLAACSAFSAADAPAADELGIGADPKLRVRINKTLAIDGLPPGHDVAAFGTPTQQRLTIGGSSYAGTGKWVVAFDNVSCQDL